MKRQMKYPGSAWERTPGAEEELAVQPNSLTQIYATSGELQSRHVRNRCGVSSARAHLIASLCFGEARR